LRQQPETAIRSAILTRLSALRTPDGFRACLVYHRYTGTARAMTDPSRVISIGVPGMADIGGMLADGRALEIEVKTPTGRLSPEQIAWRDTVTSMGALYILARSAEEAEEAVRGALRA